MPEVMLGSRVDSGSAWCLLMACLCASVSEAPLPGAGANCFLGANLPWVCSGSPSPQISLPAWRRFPAMWRCFPAMWRPLLQCCCKLFPFAMLFAMLFPPRSLGGRAFIHRSLLPPLENHPGVLMPPSHSWAEPAAGGLVAVAVLENASRQKSGATGAVSDLRWDTAGLSVGMGLLPLL